MNFLNLITIKYIKKGEKEMKEFNTKNIKNVKIGAYTHNDEICNFNFGTDLTAYGKTVFVRTVVDTLISDDNYDSIIKDLIFDFAIIMVFTNVDTSFTNAIDDNGEKIPAILSIEQFLEETNVVDIVKANMELGLLEQLEKAVDKSIEYRTGIHPSPIADWLSNLFSTLEKKISEVDLNNAMSMAQKFANMTGELTPDSIMKAYIDSDIFKKNAEEIEESKKQKAKIADNLDKAIKIVNEDEKKKTRTKKTTKTKADVEESVIEEKEKQ